MSLIFYLGPSPKPVYVQLYNSPSPHVEPSEVQLVCVTSTTAPQEVGYQVAPAQNELVKAGMSGTCVLLHGGPHRPRSGEVGG